jgi:hypothetical protein
VIRRLWDWVRWPPPYDGPILSGRIDGFAYLLGWTATFAHLTLWVFVLLLGLDTLLLLTIVIVIHRRVGERHKLPRTVVWQWWLGPWDPVGRLVWLPVRLPEAARALVRGVPGDA